MNQAHPEAHVFHAMYANLPLPFRSEIVAIVDNEPMTFRVIELELNNDTVMGFKALEFLKKNKLPPYTEAKE